VDVTHAGVTVADLERHEIRPKAVVRGMIDSWVVGSHCPDPDGFDLELLQLP
jgi:hypothetical protein